MRGFIPAAKFGLCYPPNGIKRYVDQLGVNVTKRLLMTCEEFGDKQLADIGYLTQLVEPQLLPSTTSSLATQLCALAPIAIRP